MEMKKVLVTGCNGQLGRALNSILKDTEIEVVNTDADKLDICNAEEVDRFVSEVKPDTIINCAAYTAVNKCETDAETAWRVNAYGPGNLAKAAEKTGAQIVQVSTDYVFNGSDFVSGGKAERPYNEEDKPDPQSVYGKTKLEGEQAVIKNCSRYYIVRTAWLYGDGNNFVKTMLKLAGERDSITVVDDQWGTPTSALELARMILYIIPSGEYGIYHGTCEGETSWYGFACEIMKQAGKDVAVIPVKTSEYKTEEKAAKRPAYSVLENKKLASIGKYRMKGWKEAFTEYMQQMGYVKNTTSI